MSSIPNRRDFLKTTGAAAAVTFAWPGGAKATSISANEKLQIACIGTANRALDDINGVRGEDIVALCDCLLYTSPSPRDKRQSRMPSSA